VDYFQLLFDTHQIIFAEGISAETMQADTRTRPILPQEINQELPDAHNVAASHAHQAIEVTETLLKRPNVVDLLRRASSK